METTQLTDSRKLSNEETWDVIQRANKGDKSTLPTLREIFRQRPGLVESYGDLAKRNEQRLLEKFLEKDLCSREAVSRKLDSLRKELAGPNPSFLEKLLVDRVAICWLYLQFLEGLVTCNDDLRIPGNDFQGRLASQYQRMITTAQHRYLAALKTLAVVRKLALPVLIGQVNIANKQQVNNPSLPAVQAPQDVKPASDQIAVASPENGQ